MKWLRALRVRIYWWFVHRTHTEEYARPEEHLR